MSHLTLQEVIERINGNQFSREGPANLRTNRTTEQPHRPEFFIPQKYPLANLQMVSAASVQLDCNMSAS